MLGSGAKMTGRILLFILILELSLSACRPPATFCDSVTDVSISECEALIIFYNATGGADWKDRRGWLESPHVCEWFGVSCAGGHVKSLSMNYVEITGQIPPVRNVSMI
jgi:hypothetical protein